MSMTLPGHDSDRILASKQRDFACTVAIDGIEQSPVRPVDAEADLMSGVVLEQKELFSVLGSGLPQSRYRTHESLGLGASGQVFAIEDRNLARVVAVKVLSGAREDPEEIGHFVHEAQIIASLSHPNVLPIYDQDVASDGRVYFTMPRISGRSLGAVVETCGGTSRDPRIAQPADVARIGVAVAQALAYAHHKRIIHQDVKPDNIMLGDFGEVLLVDWGSAARLEPGSTFKPYGTPLYMSPEQGRGEQADERSDVYCLGASLFHVLLLRVPTWSDDPQEFWRRKRSGEIDRPTSEECARHPTALLDILCKCLVSDPLGRYQSIEALLTDLNAYLNGLAVAAHRETAFERMRRWHRHHGRRVYIGTALIALIATVVLLLYGERLQEIAHWGTPIISEDFATLPGPEWKHQDGGFTVKDGWLVSTGDGANILLLDRRLHGSIAVEYDGKMLPGARPCDISLGWCRNRVLTDDGQTVKSLSDRYVLHVGGYDNSGVMIENDAGALAYTSMRLVHDRIYHVRAEIEDDRLSLWVDGKLLCRWQDPFPFQDGYLYLYGFYPLKAFSHLHIFTRGVAQKIPATGVGDAFAARGDYQTAADEYAQVVLSHPTSHLGEEARYRQGLCFWRLHQMDQAMAIWQPLRVTRLGDRVRLHDLDIAFDHRDHVAVCAGMTKLWPKADSEIRNGLALSWARFVNQLQVDNDLSKLQLYIDLHDRLLSNEHEIDGAAANALLATGQYQKVVDHFPNVLYSYASALNELGRYDEVIRDFPAFEWIVNIANLLSGHFDKIKPQWTFLYPRSLLLQGRFQEAYDCSGNTFGAKTRALMAMGHLEQALLESRDDPSLHACCLLLLGRGSEIDPAHAYIRELVIGDASKALATCPWNTTEWHEARWRKAVEHWIAGDQHALDDTKEVDLDLKWDNNATIGFYQWVLRPFLLEIRGDHGALQRACAQVISEHPLIFEQRPCFDARLLTGQIDANAFLAQPARIFEQPRLQLLQAMRAELSGDHADALAHYRSWQESPLYERGECPDVVLIRFVAWRIAVLDIKATPAAVPVPPHP